MNAEQWEDRTCDYLFQAASALALVGPSVSQHLVQRLRKRTSGTHREEAMLKAKNQYCQKCSRIFVPFVNCKVDFYSKSAARRRVRYVCECSATQTIEDVPRDPARTPRAQKNAHQRTRKAATSKKLNSDVVDMTSGPTDARTQKTVQRQAGEAATKKARVDDDVDMTDSNTRAARWTETCKASSSSGAAMSTAAHSTSRAVAFNDEGHVPGLRTLQQPARKKRVVHTQAACSQGVPGARTLEGNIRAVTASDGARSMDAPASARTLEVGKPVGARTLHVENRRTASQALKDIGTKDGANRLGGSDLSSKRDAGQSGMAEKSKKKPKRNAQASRYDALRNILGGEQPKMGELGDL